jgi:hypothetical protein
MANPARAFYGSQVHANAVAQAARVAAASGDALKATGLYRAILAHCPRSVAAREALDYLLTRKIVEPAPLYETPTWVWPAASRRERAAPETERSPHFI